MLGAVERRMADSGPNDEPYTALGLMIQSCRTKACKLQAILEKSIPHPCASTARCFVVALRAHCQAHRVGKLARAVLEDMQLIAQRQAAFRGGMKHVPDIVPVARATASPSPPHCVMSNPGPALINHYGRGPQNFYHGPGHQIVALGAGNVHMAETQVFNGGSGR